MPYERTKRLPVTDLNVALSRQSEGLSDELSEWVRED